MSIRALSCALWKRGQSKMMWRGGASFVAALTYNVKGLEVLFKTAGVFSHEGMTDSHVQGVQKDEWDRGNSDFSN